MGTVRLGFILSIITKGEGQVLMEFTDLYMTSVFVQVTNTVYGTGLKLMV
jgi:hypothetical protein